MNRQLKLGHVVIALAAIAALVIVAPALGGPSLKKLVKKEVARQISKATGPAGPAGAPGPAGATNVIARNDAVQGTTAGTARSASVTCAAGQRATGGGVSVANMPQTDFKVIGSSPNVVDEPPTGWQGTIYPQTTDADALVFAYVVCAAP